MKIVLASTFVPFINGGARFIVEWLEEKLLEHGHEVERFYLPFVDSPHDLLDQMAAYRLMDLSGVGDRLIAFRPPAYLLRHPHKILWFIHHVRTFYDLWDTEYGPPPTADNRAVRHALRHADTQALREAKAVFTNSNIVGRRLSAFNSVASETLYPPIYRPERFRCDGFGDEIVAISRVEPHKRQRLLIEALARTKTPVRLRLCGRASNPAHALELQTEIRRLGLADRIVFEDRWIAESEKADILAGALAVAYLPKDEDSYGYPSLEAAHASKAVLTTEDSGGVLELVTDRHNGLICPPFAAPLAAAMDELYRDRVLAARLGAANMARLAELGIAWDHVLARLLR